VRRLLVVVLFAAGSASAQVQFTKQFCDAAGANCSAAFPPVAAGTTLTIRMTATQITGPSLAVQDASVTDSLPPQLEYLSHALASPSAVPWTCTTPAAGTSGTVQCNVDLFPNGPTTTLAIRVRIAATSAGGTFINNARFSGDLVSVFDEHLLFTVPASAAFNVTGPAIPTLSQAMLLALTAALAAISVWRARC
jgi:hypothetical protein